MYMSKDPKVLSDKHDFFLWFWTELVSLHAETPQFSQTEEEFSHLHTFTYEAAVQRCCFVNTN